MLTMGKLKEGGKGKKRTRKTVVIDRSITGKEQTDRPADTGTGRDNATKEDEKDN